MGGVVKGLDTIVTHVFGISHEDYIDATSFHEGFLRPVKACKNQNISL